MSDLPTPANETGARFLVRLDDACPTLNRKMWREVEAVLDAHDVRPIVAVIPANRDPKMMIDEPDPDFWERVRGWQARGWGIGLHGCHHAYVTRDRGLFGWSKGSEFAGLSRGEQDRRIAHGLSIFAEHGIRPDMWIAPNHAFDRVTLDVLRQRGIFSVSDRPGVWPFQDRTGIFWVPMQLWRFQERPRGVWTVCQHPNVWNDGQARQFATDVERFTGRFTDWGSIMSDFATRRRGASDVRYAAVLRTKKSVARAVQRVRSAPATTRSMHVAATRSDRDT